MHGLVYARALDVIETPAGSLMAMGILALPVILIIAVIIITVKLIKKFGKKK